MKISLIAGTLLLAGCGWFHRKAPPLDATQLVVTGVPAGAFLVVDGVQVGQPTEADNQTQVVRISPGTHTLEVKIGDGVAYREDAYAAPGEKHVITVLSGFKRE